MVDTIVITPRQVQGINAITQGQGSCSFGMIVFYALVNLHGCRNGIDALTIWCMVYSRHESYL